MKKRYLTLNKGEFLIDIMPKIESNTVIKKNVTSIGATTLEIETLRNSIIILPNLPVILLKEKAHQNRDVLAVYAERTILDIIDYISDTTIPFKKILTTPESFHKILEAMRNQKIDYRKDYFLLFDECDKICKDIDFRKSISLPIDEFFKFENKAFISATALIPRDPRFDEQGFEMIHIRPTYKVAQDIKLFKTNSALDAFGYLINQDITEKHYFIFCNSLSIITHLINSNNLKDQSSVFCSESSAERLKSAKFNHIGHKLDETKFSKYNFLTSRFFSALDIYFDKDVEIYIISDLGVADHTIIDPATDAIQIIGRFRNKDIKKNVTIFFTEDKDLISLSESVCLGIIDGYKLTYDTIKNIGKTLSDKEKASLMKEITSLLEYNQFLNRDGTKDYFKVDNYIYKHSLNKLYQAYDNLINAYKDLKIEDTDKTYFNVTYVGQSVSVIPSSSQKLFNTAGQKFKTTVREVVALLEGMEDKQMFEISNNDVLRAKLKSLYPEIVDGYDLIDRETLKLIEKPRELEREIKRAINAKISTSFHFLNDLKVEFLIGEKLSTSDINARFATLIKKHGLKMKATTTQLENFILLRRCKLYDSTWGLRIDGYKDIS
ncbi:MULTISPECIES: DEAD/DEAH box helicase family protein [Sphingobacterium]|uniref:DEAD/DEAH box helicase family protein n=1 Tax=Sphingobacterium TaxID=28453 RepID=UPI00104A38CB|nr:MULTISPECIES: DEAD/DEAH box helicase family protein [Sphingobacterium]MCW2260715.1 hypothetical protein [Sphingobacterium kitahiroshimense]TCR09013.1 hypothetical protein EDF67_106178 [Sphingobacterium sp. JUb78]